MSLSTLLTPLSLPLASLLALPLLSSRSTSLNLLFFSVTWTTLALSYSPLQLEFFGPLILRIALYILPSLIFLSFDTLVPSLAVELKAQGERGIPGNGLSRKEKGKRVGMVVGWSVFNTLLGVALQAGLEWLVTDVLHMRSLLLIKGNAWSLNHLPNPWMLFKQVSIGLVSRNFLAYHIHRHLLHAPNNPPLTRLHATWHHSIRAPYSITAAYDHPLCYLLHRVVPLYVPAILFRFHIMSYLLLLALFSLEELFTYSGYNMLPSMIMLKGMARRTDAHMMSGGKGNFGPVGVLDWVSDTTLGADVMEDVQAEAEKHNVQGKVGGAAEDAGSMIEGFKGKAKRRGSKK